MFELTVGNTLFRWETHEGWKLNKEEHMLYQMATLTGDKFMPVQLNIWALAPEYFTEDCESAYIFSVPVKLMFAGRLKNNPPPIEIPLEDYIAYYRRVDAAEIPAMAALMRRCLCIDPELRATARELLDDPWFRGVDVD